MADKPLRIVVGVTGASGIIYAFNLLRFFKEQTKHKTFLIQSFTAEKLEEHELGGGKKLVRLADHVYRNDDLWAPLASGSQKWDSMVVVPCSTKYLGLMANGITNNLITRTAEVTLKEGRKLIIVPRETPLNPVHLENLYKLSLLGAVVLPAMPGFYHRPKTVEDLVNFVVGRILDSLGVEHSLYKPWGGSSSVKP